jgi:hypothetical protein
MKRVWFSTALVAILVLAFAGYKIKANDDEGSVRLRAIARMDAFQETPPKFATGRGRFVARLTDDGTALEFRLVYSGLTGKANVAHIHSEHFGIAGQVFIFLCGGGGKPGCPDGTDGEVTGTITANDVLGLPAQGLDAGDFEAALRAIRSGSTYANVHTVRFPGGEVRGQIRVPVRRDRDNDKDED